MQYNNPFRVVVCDAPWKFADKLPGIRGAESHYPCMSTPDLCELVLPPIADDAILFQWSVASMLEDAIAVTSAWGFDLKSQLVWVKSKKGIVAADDYVPTVGDLAFGMGRSVRAAHETCLIATRGKYSKLIKNKSIRSVFFAEREVHSRKPEIFFDLVESLTGGEGPYLELFSRRRRAGWVTLGSDLGTTLDVAV